VWVVILNQELFWFKQDPLANTLINFDFCQTALN